MKYNKIIRNFALMVVASSTLIACDDFLDREPLDQVSLLQVYFSFQRL